MISFRSPIAAASAGAAPSERNTHPNSASVKETLSRILATPDLFPAEIDFRRNALVFVPMSRRSFRQLSFLDNRFVRPGPGSFSVNLLELLPKCSAVQANPPLHFVLHGAFCGSTLMARLLEELPHCFALKEPGLLAQLARLKDGTSVPDMSGPGSWMDWFKVATTLFGRAYPTDTAVIIKPNDVCNWMGNLLLDRDESTRIIFLSSPLRTFLLSVLKMDDRRKWARGRVRQLKGYVARVPFLSEIPVEDLSDGQYVAALWLLNSFLCSSFLARPDSARVRALNGEELVLRPQETLRETANFFGLSRDEADRAALAKLGPLSYHAKHRHLPYDARARTIDQDNAEARFGREVDAAISWARQMSSGWLSQSPFPLE
jgi:hypothetical protein